MTATSREILDAWSAHAARQMRALGFDPSRPVRYICGICTQCGNEIPVGGNIVACRKDFCSMACLHSWSAPSGSKET